MPLKEDWAMAEGNMNRELMNFGPVVTEICLQTDIHAANRTTARHNTLLPNVQ